MAVWSLTQRGRDVVLDASPTTRDHCQSRVVGDASSLISSETRSVLNFTGVHKLITVRPPIL